MKKLAILLIAACLIGTADVTYAALGCTLNDPDRDIRQIFPEATGYRTEFITINDKGGKELVERVEKLLGDKFDNVYEASDVPYAYYYVLKGTNVIGYVHGVNQKGKYGGMQLILATDLDGKIVSFYFQKITSPDSTALKAKEFTDKFIGLTLADFLNDSDAQGRIAKITDPTQNKTDDFKATLRGVKKNMILLNEFIIKSKGSGK